MFFDRCPTLVVVPHADAGDRSRWTADQDTRPLSELGRRQASDLAAEVGQVDAVYSSPARRCTETVEPIAAASGVEVVVLQELHEIGSGDELRTWDPWDPTPPFSDWMLAAAGLGRIWRAIATAAEAHSDGRVVLCAHGDLVPLVAIFGAANLRAPLPPPIARGGAWEISRSSGVRSLGAVEPLPE